MMARLGRGSHRDTKEEVWRTPCWAARLLKTLGLNIEDWVGADHGRNRKREGWGELGTGQIECAGLNSLDSSQGWLRVWRVSPQGCHGWPLFWRCPCMCRVHGCSCGWRQEFGYGAKANNVEGMWYSVTRVQRLEGRPRSRRHPNMESTLFGSDFIRWFYEMNKGSKVSPGLIRQGW